jgi:hypothetical protein
MGLQLKAEANSGDVSRGDGTVNARIAMLPALGAMSVTNDPLSYKEA